VLKRKETNIKVAEKQKEARKAAEKRGDVLKRITAVYDGMGIKLEELFGGDLKDIQKRVNHFANKKDEIAGHVCGVCHQLYFRKGVTDTKRMRDKGLRKAIEEEFVSNELVKEPQFVCITCRNHIKRNQANPVENWNGPTLSAKRWPLPKRPDCLINLNRLERSLIAGIQPFVKIRPRYRHHIMFL